MSVLRDFEAMMRELARQQGIEIPNRPTPTPVPPPTRPQPYSDLYEVVEDVEVVESEVVGRDIAAHVRTTMDTTDVTNRASHLAEEVSLADDKLDAHLHTKFDHQVGHLKSGGGMPAAVTQAEDPLPSVVASIAQMLKNPRDIQTAILLHEVLTPPTYRW